MKKIKANVMEILKDNKITYEEIGNDLKISKASISNYLNEFEYNVRFGFIIYLIEKLGYHHDKKIMILNNLIDRIISDHKSITTISFFSLYEFYLENQTSELKFKQLKKYYHPTKLEKTYMKLMSEYHLFNNDKFVMDLLNKNKPKCVTLRLYYEYFNCLQQYIQDEDINRLIKLKSQYTSHHIIARAMHNRINDHLAFIQNNQTNQPSYYSFIYYYQKLNLLANQLKNNQLDCNNFTTNDIECYLTYIIFNQQAYKHYRQLCLDRMAYLDSLEIDCIDMVAYRNILLNNNVVLNEIKPICNHPFKTIITSYLDI